MSVWYRKVTANLGEIVPAISHYEKEIEQARFECSMKGVLEKQSRDMPGIVEHRFNQLQEVEAILETDPVAKHVYQRLLQLRSEFKRMPIPPTLEPVDKTIEQVLKKIDRRSRRNFVLVGSAVAGLIAAISGFISTAPSPLVNQAEVSDSETIQIALNEPVMEIVNPDNVMLTVNEPLLQIPQVPIKTRKN